ncbi:MAG: hypothetical protein J6X19_02975 [Clostridia bacterium]|jgi:peptidoglycan/LPS O-acetylase OafA/YrhL|nr:hypothetical protein [Clostridia bacterium]MBP5730146.1 hypothetical protein [Clostridia bacterium]
MKTRSEQKPDNGSKKRIVRIIVPVVLTVAALALIAIGIASNQLTAVWSKAAKLCLECVGIG